MSTKKFLLVLLVYIPLIIPTDVSAWDHQRKGFILGAGMGPAIIENTSTTGNIAESRNNSGFGMDFKIGYATSNTFQIYLFQNISIFDDTFMDTITVWTIAFPFTEERVVEERLGHWVLGIGVSYYLKEEAPSFFFDGGMGFCSFGDPIFQDTKDGTAFNFAGGYEFSRYLNIKLKFLGASSSSDVSGGTYKESKFFTFMFTINILGY